MGQGRRIGAERLAGWSLCLGLGALLWACDDGGSAGTAADAARGDLDGAMLDLGPPDRDADPGRDADPDRDATATDAAAIDRGPGPDAAKPDAESDGAAPDAEPLEPVLQPLPPVELPALAPADLLGLSAHLDAQDRPWTAPGPPGMAPSPPPSCAGPTARCARWARARCGACSSRSTATARAGSLGRAAPRPRRTSTTSRACTSPA